MKKLPVALQKLLERNFQERGGLAVGRNVFKKPSGKVFGGYVDFYISPKSVQAPVEYAEVTLLLPGAGAPLRGAAAVRPAACVEGLDLYRAARLAGVSCQNIRQEINTAWGCCVETLARGETPKKSRPYIPSVTGGFVYGLRRLAPGHQIGVQGLRNLADQTHWSARDLGGEFTLVKYRQRG